MFRTNNINKIIKYNCIQNTFTCKYGQTYLPFSRNINILNKEIKETDIEVWDIIEKEKKRQRDCINLIASENYTSTSVYDCLGSVMSNKYSEGYPMKRYYGGNQYIDQMELLCQKRAIETFHLDSKKWGVNVQSLSGSPANFQVFSALLKPHDRIMGLDLPHGGHLSHGYQINNNNKKISSVSIFFETFPYHLNPKTELIDYDELSKDVNLIKPKLIIAGTSAYSRLIDYKRMRTIADQCDAILLADMAHISGLVAAEEIPSPFEYADIVTTTTHKSLRGPRGAMIFYRKGIKKINKKTNKEIMYDYEDKINFSVFPGLQGGPHNHTIAALTTALKQANTIEFKEYIKNVIKNSKSIVNYLQSLNYEIVSNGTDTHLFLVNVKKSFPFIDGAKTEYILEKINIIVNKNTIYNDTSALTPSGIRIGTPALTTRGINENACDTVGTFLHEGILLTNEINNVVKIFYNKKEKENTNFKLFKDFVEEKIINDETNNNKMIKNKINELKEKITIFMRGYEPIGYDWKQMKYKD